MDQLLNLAITAFWLSCLFWGGAMLITYVLGLLLNHARWTLLFRGLTVLTDILTHLFLLVAAFTCALAIINALWAN